MPNVINYKSFSCCTVTFQAFKGNKSLSIQALETCLHNEVHLLLCSIMLHRLQPLLSFFPGGLKAMLFYKSEQPSQDQLHREPKTTWTLLELWFRNANNDGFDLSSKDGLVPLWSWGVAKDEGWFFQPWFYTVVNSATGQCTLPW